MNDSEQCNKELAGLKDLRINLVSERDKALAALEDTQRKAIQLVLEQADISELAVQKTKLELMIDASLAAIELLDVRIKVARDLASAAEQAQAEQEFYQVLYG